MNTAMERFPYLPERVDAVVCAELTNGNGDVNEYEGD
jgi:hypothetical protein